MKSIELFAGIGGIALAAEWAGIETIAFCERDPFCQKVLKKHWSDVPIFDNVCTLNRKVLEEQGVIESGGTVDIISGGFPCQPYSVAGKQKGTDDDRDLWPEMFRIIEELRPTWVVGENVANFANMELDRTLSNLESIGYKGKSFIIPACAVDAKHRRDRTFVVAHSNSFRRNDGPHYREKGQIQIEFYRDYSKSEQEWEGRFNRIGEICTVFPDTTSIGQQGQRKPFEPFNSEKDRERKASESIDVCFGGKWEPEPNVGRVANGIPNRVDRLRALGNAVVPQQIYPIFDVIMKISQCS